MASKIYTTERTSKRWKAIQALGFLGALAGIVLVVSGTTTTGQFSAQAPGRIILSTTSVAGLLTFLGGVCVQLFGRLGGWWYHG
jgi:hypothetical protein